VSEMSLSFIRAVDQGRDKVDGGVADQTPELVFFPIQRFNESLARQSLGDGGTCESLISLFHIRNAITKRGVKSHRLIRNSRLPLHKGEARVRVLVT